MKIVVLDGYTANPGDLSWSDLESLGECVIYDRTLYEEEEIIRRSRGAEIILTNKTPLNRGVLEGVKDTLKYIGVMATGYNIVDISAAKEWGITVTNVPGYSTDSVVQHTFALILELTNGVGIHSRSVYEGEWASCKDFSYTKTPLTELSGKTLGLIGYGSIGKEVGLVAKAFGMKVLAYRGEDKETVDTDDVRFVAKEEIFTGDIVSLHCPLTEETKDIVNKETLSLMKESAFLVNTARGGCVDEEALAEALNSGKIRGAALDVVKEEPIREDNPLLKAKNCILTPHIAWAPYEARERLLRIVYDNVKAFLEGNSVHTVTG